MDRPTAARPSAAEVQRHLWTVGDYREISRHLLRVSVDTADALPIGPGTTVLDVGCGDGNLAFEARRRGAAVTGVDVTPAQIERARVRARAEGLDVDLRVGDATDLDVDDGSFDVVASVLGLIFAADHQRAVAEMARAARPGGTVAIVAWSGGGWSAAWQRRAADLVPAPPPGGPRPDLWGEPDEARRRLRAAGAIDVEVAIRPFAWELDSIEATAELFLRASGPFITFMEAATALGRGDQARAALVEALVESAVEVDGGLAVPMPYLLATGVKP